MSDPPLKYNGKRTNSRSFYVAQYEKSGHKMAESRNVQDALPLDYVFKCWKASVIF